MAEKIIHRLTKYEPAALIQTTLTYKDVTMNEVSH